MEIRLTGVMLEESIIGDVGRFVIRTGCRIRYGP